MTESSPQLNTGALVRRVGTFTAACLLVSNMIGTGIFGTTGFMAADLGKPWLILALWGAGAVFSLLGACAYGELGAMLPQAGGEYVYIRRAFGPLAGFLSGWTSLLVGFSAAIAGTALLFAEHVRQLFPDLAPGEDAAWWVRGHVLELGMLWALTLVHVAGVGAGGFVQRLLTIVKVGALVALVLAGVSFGDGDWGHLSEAAADVSPGWQTILVSFMFVTFSYSGWNAASYIGGEIIEPGKNLPRAMLWGTAAVGALYLAINTVYFYALPVGELADDPIAVVGQKSAEALFGTGIERWFTAMITVSILGAASAMIWAGPRVYYAMARDGVFPHFFAATGESTHVPVRSIVLQSAWVSVLVFSTRLRELILYASFVLILFSGLAVASVMVLRRREPEVERPYRTWGYPLTPVVFLLLSAAILWAGLEGSSRESSLWGLGTVLAGVPFFFLWKRRV